MRSVLRKGKDVPKGQSDFLVAISDVYIALMFLVLMNVCLCDDIGLQNKLNKGINTCVCGMNASMFTVDTNVDSYDKPHSSHFM